MSRSTSVVATSLNPPAIAELDTSGALPPWVLLETRVYFAHRDDSTAASCKTSRPHHEIVVSIAFADPPALSFVCLRCPTLSTNNFVGEPRVLRSQKQFLLLHLPLTWTTSGVLKRSNEYYIYQVTDQGRKPTLSRIPDPSPDCLLMPDDLGIYCTAADGEYVVAGLCPTSDAEAHELHLYSSKTNAWTMRPARLENRPKYGDRRLVTAHKVIPLGGSLLGWVDLWKGILVCDVLSRPTRRRRPVPLRFIPFPARLPGNTTDHLCPWKVRDVACTNGLLKFFEVEHYEVPLTTAVQKTVPADLPDVVYDDPPAVEPDDDSDTMAPSLYGWRSVIWNRALHSDNCWRLRCNVRFHDISSVAVNPSPSAFLDGHAAGNWETIASYPNLSIHGDDVVHMKSLVRLDGVSMRHMVSIDMTSKALKALVPCAAAKQDTYCPHFPSVLSKYLSNAPDLPKVVQASSSENVNAAPPQIIQESHSQNITENECSRSCAQDVIGSPSQAQDMMASYNRSHHEYADGTRPFYDNTQWSWPLQQQPTYLPNWAPRPSWLSPGSANVFNTTAFGWTTHPPPFMLPTPFSTQFPPSILPPVAGHSLGSGHQMPHRRSPYEPPWQTVYPY